MAALLALALALVVLLQVQGNWNQAWGLKQQVQCADAQHQEGCTISPWLAQWGDRQPCAFARVVRPRTEQELVQAVAEAVRHGRKVKATRGYPHSTPKLTCPGTSSGILISTEDYDNGVTVDAEAGTATVGAGTQLHQLLEALGEAGLSLPSVPVWSFLSVVGLMATGAHGSSLFPDSHPLHDRVLSLRIVVPASAEEGHAKVLEVSAESDPEVLAAARISLGVLGAISQVTIRADAIYKREIKFEHAGDADLPERVLSHARESEFGEIFWFPSQRRAVFLHSSRVPVSTPGDHVYGMAALQPTPAALSLSARKAQEQHLLGEGSRSQACEMAAALVDASWPVSAPVVGFSHNVQSTEACLHPPAEGGDEGCLWENSWAHFHETSFTIAASRVADFVREVGAVRDKRPDSLCNLAFYYGFWFRYIPGGSGALLGETQDAVDVNALYFRAAEPELPRLDQDVLDEIEQLAMVKYAGKPHWGKSNRFVSFLGTADKYGERLKRFVSVKNRLDPDGIFSSPWTDAVLGIEGGTSLNQHRPFCGLDGLCICQHDEHCNRSAGYFCRPGLVFPEARVCRFEKQILKDEL